MRNRLILLVFLLLSNLLLNAKPFSQDVSEAKIKAALIINFAQNIQWPNESKIPSYLIGLIDQDSSVYKELLIVRSKQTIKGKPFDVVFVDQQTFYSNFNIIYFSEKADKALSNFYRTFNEIGALIITDRSKDRLLTMVNIVYNPTKSTFSYEINKENLDASGFVVNPKILVYGGNYVDLKELYIQTYEQLRVESERIEQYKQELEKIGKERDDYQSEIQELNRKILDLALNIKKSEDEYADLTSKLQVKDSVLSVRTIELQSKINESKELQGLIKSQLKAIGDATGKLDSLDLEIENKQQDLNEKQIRIDKQNEEIGNKELIILKHQKRFFVSVLILLGLALSLIFAYWAYSIKKRLNVKLEHLVEERTKELQVSREHFVNLFENSPVAMFELDLSDLKVYVDSVAKSLNFDDLNNDHQELILKGVELIKIVSLNQSGIDLFKFKNKQDAFLNYAKTYNEQSLASFKMVFESIFNNRLSHAYEGLRQTVDGDILYVHLKWLVLPGFEDNYKRVLLSISDITALKNYQKELNRHKDHLEEIVLERTNEIIKLNADLLITNEELQQRTQELSQIIERLNETQDQLIQSEKMASLGMLTAGIAHEINNPVNFISGSYQALQSLLDDFWAILNNYHQVISQQLSKELLVRLELEQNLNPRETYDSMKLLISNIEVGINRTTEIIRSLMAFSRSSGQNFSEYDIRSGVRDVLVILKAKYVGRISIFEDYDPDLPLINCNASGISQVIMNLVSNAIDAIASQGEVRISVKYNKETDEVVFVVNDSGSGIPDDIIDKIFDPFFTTKEVGAGTGLGLYISYNMVKAHDGIIFVDSELGIGTTFTVRLPRTGFRGGAAVS